MMFLELSKLLSANHGMENGCYRTKYDSIPGLVVSSATANGTSGVGFYFGTRVYWEYDCGSFNVTKV